MASSKSDNLHVRPVQLKDFDEINRMMTPLGYNDSPHIYRLCYSSIDAMYWVCTNDRGEIVAFDSMHRLSIENQSIIFGLIKSVLPEYQGLGITKRFSQYYRHLPSVGNMTRMGFMSTPGKKKFGKKVIIYVGQPNGDFFDAKHQSSDVKISQLNDDSQMEEVIAYDRTVFDYDRSAYVRAWSSNSKPDEQYSRTLVARGLDNRVIGYGTIRLLEETYAIQPVYADLESVAEVLLRELLLLHKTESKETGLPIIIYVFAENRLMMRFVSQNEMEPVGNGFRTYVEEGGESSGRFRAEVIEKYISTEKIYCTQFYWPA